MIHSERILVMRKGEASMYGRVIDTSGKVGRYEVYSERVGSTGNIYHRFAEAEKAFQALVGHHNTDYKPSEKKKK